MVPALRVRLCARASGSGVGGRGREESLVDSDRGAARSDSVGLSDSVGPHCTRECEYCHGHVTHFIHETSSLNQFFVLFVCV